MYQNPLRKSAPVAALLALAALGGSAAHAGQTVFDPNGTAAQLGAGASITAPYPLGAVDPASGDGNFYVSSPYTQTAGGLAVTFTATGERTNGVFGSFDSAGFDFAPGTRLLNTFDGRYPPGTLSPDPYGSNGPLQIDFRSGVGAFGVQVQSAALDLETFTFSTYNGSALVGTYTTPQFDNTDGVGKSLFLGAQATGGDLFTRVVISSVSIAEGAPQATTNDFYFGPLGMQPVGMQPAAVPEASTVVSLALTLALLGGGALTRRRRAARA